MGTCFQLVSTGKAQVRLPNWQFLSPALLPEITVDSSALEAFRGVGGSRAV